MTLRLKNSVLLLVHLLVAFNSVSGLGIVSRDEWGARPPEYTKQLAHPVPYVVIHHSYIPAACNTKESCAKAMKAMQNYHMDTHEWEDIGYSFGSGSDGKIYTGRGWAAVGVHAPNYNSRSIGICLIGDWRTEVPPKIQLDAVKELIQYGVEKGYISPNYKLIGHKQATATECPGNALYTEIKTWDHWTSSPSK